MSLMGSSLNWTQLRNKEWAWIYVNRNFPNQKAKKEKTKKKSRTESPRNYKRCNITCNRNTRRKGKREGNAVSIWSNNGWEESKVINRYQTTDPGRLVNTKLHKWQKFNTYTYHIQNAENQRQRKSWKKPQG